MTSSEVFLTSIEVLITRLREVPALSKRLQELLGKKPENIHWSPDASEVEYQAPQENFTAGTIMLSVQDSEQVATFLKAIEVLYRNEQS